MKTLGIDTSNYTCSVAVYDSDSGTVEMKKQLLPVPENTVGLRQSQAVFEQVRLLGTKMRELFRDIDSPVEAIGVSVRPRSVEGSYMPCFLVGETVAEAVSAVIKCPVSHFSHQEGHLAAALYSAEKLDWLSGEPHAFFAFHLSGGTTECLRVFAGGGKILKAECLGKSLDLHAGQAVDRVGKLLGLPFPAGPELDKMASKSSGNIFDKINAKIPNKGFDCCLSGLENICTKQLSDGKSPEDTAYFCLRYIIGSVENILKNVFAKYGEHPVLFVGGVSGNSLLQKYFKEKYESIFAKREFSSDNAAGIAVLAYLEERYALL